MSDSETVVLSVQIPDHVVDDVAEELEEISAEPTPENIRDRVFDRVSVSPEFVDEERHPVVDRVVKSVASS